MILSIQAIWLGGPWPLLRQLYPEISPKHIEFWGMEEEQFWDYDFTTEFGGSHSIQHGTTLHARD